MRTSDVEILIVPGIGDSGPDHWQSRWESKLSTARRIVQSDWIVPRLADWTLRVVEEAQRATLPVVLVAHSFGVIAAVAAAPALEGKVIGGFFVAPPSERIIRAMIDANMPGIDPLVFHMPRARLPFPSVVVASRTDDFSAFAESQDIAAAWGSTFADAGESGHINVDSGHGPWPEGLLRFTGFMKML